MGFLRFRRSITIIPGLRVNLGKKGVSLSAGVRGANVTVGKTGVHTTVGVPGTGLSYTETAKPGRDGAVSSSMKVIAVIGAGAFFAMAKKGSIVGMIFVAGLTAVAAITCAIVQNRQARARATKDAERGCREIEESEARLKPVHNSAQRPASSSADFPGQN